MFCGVLLEFRSRAWIQGGKSGVSNGCVCIEIPKKTAQSFVCSLSGEVGHNCARSHGCLASDMCVPASVCPCVTEWVKRILRRCLLLVVATVAFGDLRTSSPVDSMCCVIAAPHSDWWQTGGLIVSCSCSR